MTLDPLAAVDANMQTAWRALTSIGPKPVVAESDDALLLSSGLPVALFNPAFVLRQPADPDALIRLVTDHYKAIGSPFVLYFRDDVAPGLGETGIEMGLVEHFRPPMMVLDPIVPAPPAPGLEIVDVDDESIEAYRAVLAAGFGMPEDFVRTAFPTSTLGLPGFSALLALLDGEPVGTSAAFLTGDIVGVYNVSTVPSRRGQGIGAAITWAAVAAGAAKGAKTSILQASEAGTPVYERMGFVTRDRYRQLEPRS